MTAEVSVPGRVSREYDSGGGTSDSFRAGGTEMAVAGFVMSVLWLFFLGSLLGLCLGAAAWRRLATEESAEGRVPAPWAGKLALAAVVIGGLGIAFAAVLAVLQVSGLVDITAACHPAVTGVTCRLIVR